MAEREYKRDKRSPIPKDSAVSKVMSSIKSKNTKPELFFRKSLFKNCIRGYRINYSGLPGRPDVVFTKYKVAIFVNGCYWHKCPICNLPMPKNNENFWRDKFENNTKRDRLKTEQLIELGWKVITIWECQVKNDIDNVIILVKKSLN